MLYCNCALSYELISTTRQKKSKWRSVWGLGELSVPRSEGTWGNCRSLPELQLSSYISQHPALQWSDGWNWLPCLHYMRNSHFGIYFAVRNINPLHPRVQIDYKTAFCWHWHICGFEYVCVREREGARWSVRVYESVRGWWKLWLKLHLHLTSMKPFFAGIQFDLFLGFNAISCPRNSWKHC